MGIQTNIMPDASEVIPYNSPGTPLYIYTNCLSSYHEMRALCHWHEDLELICIRSGKMNYHINGKRILLKTGDALIVNSRQMHYGYDFQKQECWFSCILFHPSLLRFSQQLYLDYVRPVIENPSFEFLHLASSQADAEPFTNLITHITEQKEKNAPFYELEAIASLTRLWKLLLSRPDVYMQKNAAVPNTDLDLQRTIVAFIYQNYSEKLTLNEIASAGNVGRNKCCALFRKYLQQSPIDFLNHYRLEVSCDLLRNTDKSITEIAFACGFAHLSYYTKLFVRSYGCTPSEFRKTKCIIH